MKLRPVAPLLGGLLISVSAQAHSDHPAQPVVKPSTVAADVSDRNVDRQAVEAVLTEYKRSIERLDATGTERLFTPDSQIFETGGSEGTYENYLEHHLGPELGHFKSLRFSDYKVNVRLEGPIALATETYRYRIEPDTGEPVERLGVATSVLKKVEGQWKIVIMHNSARRPPAS